MTSGSGVTVNDQVQRTIDVMRVRKHDQDHATRPRVLLLKIVDEKEIVIGQEFAQKDLDGVDDIYMFVMGLLKKKECCYVLYDCHYQTNESPKHELAFIMWTPDDAPIKTKMIYSSSKGSLRTALQGVKHDMAFHDCGDIADNCKFIENISKNSKLVALEGKKL